jgi:hypothetical protein
MNDQQRQRRQEELTYLKEKEAKVAAGTYPLNCAPTFWDAYRTRAGSIRRRALLAIFEHYPLSKLPVNNKWQAKSADPDLAVLLKRGVLVQVRSGGCRRHPLNKTSSKRQTYLMLATLPKVVA